MRASSQAGKKWADRKRAGKPVRGRILSEEFDWEDDVNPETPYAETILYKLHVRGFTAHASSGVSPAERMPVSLGRFHI